LGPLCISTYRHISRGGRAVVGAVTEAGWDGRGTVLVRKERVVSTSDNIGNSLSHSFIPSFYSSISVPPPPLPLPVPGLSHFMLMPANFRHRRMISSPTKHKPTTRRPRGPNHSFNQVTYCMRVIRYCCLSLICLPIAAGRLVGW